MRAQLAPSVRAGEGTDEVVGAARALPVDQVVRTLPVLTSSGALRIHPVHHRLHHRLHHWLSHGNLLQPARHSHLLHLRLLNASRQAFCRR